jgi:hypothetical protein
MPGQIPIKYKDLYLGDLITVSSNDWINKQRQPTPLDFEMVKIQLAAHAIYEILDRHPDHPGDQENDDDPWFITILKLVCHISKNGQFREFEEDVLRYYIERYGMNQIIQMFGGSPQKIFEEIENMKRDL